MRQGGLDLTYMHARFLKGKQWVENWMGSHHRCMALSLKEAHADLLKWQRAETSGGNNGFLVFNHACLMALFEADAHGAGCILVAGPCRGCNLCQTRFRFQARC